MDNLEKIQELRNNILEKIYYHHQQFLKTPKNHNGPKPWPDLDDIKKHFENLHLPPGLFPAHVDTVITNLEKDKLIRIKKRFIILKSNGTRFVEGKSPTLYERKTLAWARIAVYIATGSFLLSLLVYFLNTRG